MYKFECRKCGNQFESPMDINHTSERGVNIIYYVCPLCRSRSIVRMWCAFCDFYINRGVECEMGNITIVPFNVRCEQWKIRSLDKPEVK